MKKLICMFLSVIMILGLCACGGSEGGTGAKSGLTVGYGKEKMMPKEPVYIAGGEDPTRISTGYMDFLYATCIAVTDEKGNTLLFITVDMQSVAKSWGEAARALVSQETGVPGENIHIASTHNHSGPGQNSDYQGVTAFKEVYNASIVRAAKAAMEDRSPATIEAGSTETQDMVFVRHYWMNDGTSYGNGHGSTASGYKEHMYDADETIQLVRFVRADAEKKDVLLMNYGSHATFNGSKSSGTSLSANYPGPARDYVEKNSDCLVAHFISAAGDQTPGSSVKPHDMDYVAYGEAYGKAVVEALDSLKPVAGGEIRVASEVWTAGTNKMGIERLAEATEVYNYFLEGGSAAATQKATQMGFSSVYEARSIVQHSKMGDTYDYRADALVIGELAIVIASYEMFGMQGTYIRENSPYENTFVITCANESNSYVSAEIGYEHHFYEANTSNCEKGTAEVFAQKFVDMLGKLKAN